MTRTEDFDKNATITVRKQPDDPCQVTDALKNSLVANGFKVLSEVMSENKIEINNRAQKNDSILNQNISKSEVTYVNSQYLITFTYTSFVTHNDVAELNGQIVDLTKNGQIVATFSYMQKGLRMVKTRDLTTEIVKELKK